MTDEEINIELAVLCGTHLISREDKSNWYLVDKNGNKGRLHKSGHNYSVHPDFVMPKLHTKSLDDVHEAWKQLISKRQLHERFCECLYDLINQSAVEQTGFEADDLMPALEVMQACVTAPPRMRAEAIVLTLNNSA